MLLLQCLREVLVRVTPQTPRPDPCHELDTHPPPSYQIVEITTRSSSCVQHLYNYNRVTSSYLLLWTIVASIGPVDEPYWVLPSPAQSILYK